MKPRKSPSFDFEPWGADDLEKIRSELGEWLVKDSHLAVTLRLSTVILGLSKNELVKGAENLDPAILEMLDIFEKHSDFLIWLGQIIKAAHARQAVAVSLVAANMPKKLWFDA